MARALVRANAVGFDLLAIDLKGKIFPKNQIVCISVKARISKKKKIFRPTIPVGAQKILSAQKIWNIPAWIGIVVGGTETLEAFLFPFNDLPKLRGNAKRKGVVSVTALSDNSTKSVWKLFPINLF